MFSFYLTKILCLILLSMGNSSCQVMAFGGLMESIYNPDPIEWGVSVTLCGNVTLGQRAMFCWPHLITPQA